MLAMMFLVSLIVIPLSIKKTFDETPSIPITAHRFPALNEPWTPEEAADARAPATPAVPARTGPTEARPTLPTDVPDAWEPGPAWQAEIAENAMTNATEESVRDIAKQASTVHSGSLTAGIATGAAAAGRTIPESPKSEVAPAEPTLPVVAHRVMGADEVREAVSDAGVSYCFDARKVVDPSLSGRIEVGWDVEHGKPVRVRITANSTGDRDLARCVADRVGAMRFSSDVTGHYSWPFLFRPPENG